MLMRTLKDTVKTIVGAHPQKGSRLMKPNVRNEFGKRQRTTNRAAAASVAPSPKRSQRDDWPMGQEAPVHNLQPRLARRFHHQPITTVARSQYGVKTLRCQFVALSRVWWFEIGGRHVPEPASQPSPAQPAHRQRPRSWRAGVHATTGSKPDRQRARSRQPTTHVRFPVSRRSLSRHHGVVFAGSTRSKADATPTIAARFVYSRCGDGPQE
jgi:hypothetical protein